VTIYSILGITAAIALAITLMRFFIARPSNILLCFLQNFIGVFFIFSSFVKAVDPLGFSYKLDEYFDVFSDSTKQIAWFSSLMLWFKNITLFLATFMIVLEMALGWMLIFGIWMQLTMWLMLLLILFFTFLTGFSWYTGKITDCGCFGDAVHFTNAETFWKDVALTVLILILFFLRKKIKPVFPRTASNIIMVIGVAASIYLPVYCLNHLPIIDFRPYKIGNNIREEMSIPPGGKATIYKSMLTYKNKTTGEVKDYPSDNFPWNDSVWVANWEFVSTKNELVQQGDKPKITDFHVWDDNNTDMTSAVLDDPNYHFWVVAYDMNCADKKSFAKLNELAKEADKNKIQFVGLTATPYEQLDPIRHDLNAAFPFYYADGTVLKTIVRANPGLVLLRGPIPVAMWHYNDFPTYEQISSKYFH